MPEMIDLIDRAARDPDFLARLQQDPFGTARAEGYDVSHEQVREILGMEHGTEEEVAEALQARLSYSDKSGSSQPDNWRAIAGVRG